MAERFLIAVENLEVDEQTARDIRRALELVLDEFGVPCAVPVTLADSERYQVQLKPELTTPVLHVHLN